MSDHEPGNPAGLPGYDAPGEEWYASGAPEVFGPAAQPRPATRRVKSFTWLMVGLIGVGVVLLVIAMVSGFSRY